jgi:hypothetical protein
VNNDELDRLLRHACPPKRDATYWLEFPAQVTRELRRNVVGPRAAVMGRTNTLKLWAGLGFATACLIATFFFGFWHGQRHLNHNVNAADAKKYLHELQALFPNQVRAVIFDERGSHLVLSDKADVPPSDGIFVKLCDQQECQRILTFSGQQIQWRGEAFDVLADQKGGVILVGKHSVFSTERPRTNYPKVEGTTFQSL